VEAKFAALEDQLAGGRVEEAADWPAEEIQGQGCSLLRVLIEWLEPLGPFLGGRDACAVGSSGCRGPLGN
jgi:hypothetical protein